MPELSPVAEVQTLESLEQSHSAALTAVFGTVGEANSEPIVNYDGPDKKVPIQAVLDLFHTGAELAQAKQEASLTKLQDPEFSDAALRLQRTTDEEKAYDVIAGALRRHAAKTGEPQIPLAVASGDRFRDNSLHTASVVLTEYARRAWQDNQKNHKQALKQVERGHGFLRLGKNTAQLENVEAAAARANLQHTKALQFIAAITNIEPNRFAMTYEESFPYTIAGQLLSPSNA